MPVMSHRFKVGDRVQVGGILAEFYDGKTGWIVAFEPNLEGIPELDLYRIEMPGFRLGDTKFADFQLTSAPQAVRE